MVEFNEIRSNKSFPIDGSCTKTAEFKEHEQKLWDSRNYFIKEATFNYKYSHQLSVAISKMQGLTNSIRVNNN